MRLHENDVCADCSLSSEFPFSHIYSSMLLFSFSRKEKTLFCHSLGFFYKLELSYLTEY